MGKLRNNEHGFTAFELVLVLIILILVGVIGWFVYDKNHKTTPASTISTTKTTPSTPAQPVNPYTGWKSDSVNGVSFKYPSDWQINSGHDSVNTDVSISSIPYQPIISSSRTFLNIIIMQFYT